MFTSVRERIVFGNFLGDQINMTHDRLMLLLMLEYVVLMVLAIFEERYGKAVYWAGAIVLSTGVLMQR